MATLVLTAVGTAIGGPIGGAIGAILGQGADQELFKPKGRQWPRLAELRVQTSSYGSAIPKLFGTMRVAGTVIWATDLREERKNSGGGKGRPSTTTYSYSASFAVLLSGRPIRDVVRIWADGNLLRGSAGDFKTSVKFRLYRGGEDQEPDPLIASAEGASTPAYRGLAYAVFEDLALADFGNRIPSLTFEVAADEGPVSIGTIVDEIGAGLVDGQATRTLAGFAAVGDSVRDVVDNLSLVAPMTLTDGPGGLLLSDARTQGPQIDVQDRGARDREKQSIGSALTVPADLAVSYYDPERDYQAGLQRARRPGPGRRGDRIDLAVAMSAGEAKRVAHDALKRAYTERETRRLRVPWRRLDLTPGLSVAFAGEAGDWRIVGRTVGREGLDLELARFRMATAVLPAASPGRSVAAPDLVHGPTVLHVLELPALGDALLNGPRLLIPAAGTSAGWRRAALMVSLDGGTHWEPFDQTAAPAVLGHSLTALPNGGAATWDARSSVDVELLNEAMQLSDADDASLVAGANLALLGDELIQFGRATPLGGSKWRLERLTRGRRGTEWASETHAVGDRFVLIEADALLAYDPPASAIGREARVLAIGVGDGPDGVEASAAIEGASVRPPSPVALSAFRRPDGGFDLSWTRRSRNGWGWADFADAPLAEEREAYVVTFAIDGSAVRTFETSSPSCDYPATAVAADAALGAAVTIIVRQLGTFAPSREARLTLSVD